MVYCINRKVWLSAVHIPGKDNETADYMSRLQNENTEWSWRLSQDFKGFQCQAFFTVNLKLTFLHHAQTIKLTSMPHDGILTEMQ